MIRGGFGFLKLAYPPRAASCEVDKSRLLSHLMTHGTAWVNALPLKDLGLHTCWTSLSARRACCTCLGNRCTFCLLPRRHGSAAAAPRANTASLGTTHAPPIPLSGPLWDVRAARDDHGGGARVCPGGCRVSWGAEAETAGNDRAFHKRPAGVHIPGRLVGWQSGLGGCCHHLPHQRLRTRGCRQTPQSTHSHLRSPGCHTHE
jgi:hypothetical protein